MQNEELPSGYWDDLVELNLFVDGCVCPLLGRLFFDRKSLGIGLSPVDAKQGQNSDSPIARTIAAALDRNNCGYRR